MVEIKTSFPHTVREIEGIWIPLSDGARLAARLWMPTDAEDNPVPAILEYLPYRKNDATALRDSQNHPYFAGHGYACVRVDMRGTGDSDGILYDEYLPQEQEDALEVLRWIADQPWCDGSIGIIGISWGGFNGLQIAARRPPELKAIVTICSTDDRYADDVHYMGGCLLGSEMLPWASTMLAYNALPPDPRFVSEGWREMWLNRMEETPPFIEAWLSHPWRDKYWKHGSVNEDFASMTCPVYAVGGWADGYTNAVFRLLEGLPGPKKGLIGPWAHKYPSEGVPGPAIGFLQECLRWWDYWLKGIDTGIMDEPALRVWMHACFLPKAYYEELPGRWVVEPGWSSPNIGTRRYWLHESGALEEAPDGAGQCHIRGLQSTGSEAGAWLSYGLPGDFPTDQRGEDGRSLSFTTQPLAERMEILGFPEVTLSVVVDKPQALIAVRLCDVHPGGASTLISWGLLNLCHRNSHENPAPLEPGKRVIAPVKLNALAYSLNPGHRLRVSLSPTYFPHTWPSPDPAAVTIYTGKDSALDIPLRPSSPDDERLRPFDPPEVAAPIATRLLRAPDRTWQSTRDSITGEVQLINRVDKGKLRFLESGLERGAVNTDTFTITEGDPLSARVRCQREITLCRGDWRIRLETDSSMTSDETSFYVTNKLEAFEGEKKIFVKTWDFNTPRQLV